MPHSLSISLFSVMESTRMWNVCSYVLPLIWNFKEGEIVKWLRVWTLKS